MATKLKGLKISKVDFVDAGANQRANIAFFKRDAAKGGENMPKENPVKKFIAAIAKAVGMGEDEAGSALSAIAKAGAKTFNEEMVTVEVRQILDEIWDMSSAYRSSLCSVMRDDEVKDKKSLMLQNTDQFCTAIRSCIERWANSQSSDVAKSVKQPEMSEEEAAIAKARAEAFIAKVEGKGKTAKDADDVEPDNQDKNGDPQSTPKKGETTMAKSANKAEGEEDDMKINKSLLTSEERMFLEAIEKKAGIADNVAEEESVANTSVTKGADTVALATSVQEAGQKPVAKSQPEDVFAGLPTAVTDIIKNLQKKADDAENRELMEVAKKYEILGTKADDLMPVLKGLKKEPAQYEKTIAMLDSAVAATAGAFAEIGKRGSLDNPNGSAWDKIEKKAAEIRKAAPDMGYHEAIDKACSENPELVAEYESNR